jgi:CHAT domain-containing protein/tetratricopeptide (TPR) repeat protein
MTTPGAREALGTLGTFCGVLVLAGCLASHDTDPWVNRITALIEHGDYLDADRLASELAERALARRVPDPMVMLAIAEARTAAGRAIETQTLDLAREAVDRLASTRGAVLARAHDTLGNVRFERGEFREAEAAYRRALDVRRASPGTPLSAVAESLEQLAETMVHLERYDEAARLVSEAERTRETTTSSAAGTARHRFVEALVRRHNGDYPAAAAALDAAWAAQIEAAPEHPDAVRILHLRGEVSFLRGDVRLAHKAWDSARVLGERVLGDRHPHLAATLRLLAFTTDARGDRHDARLLLERASRLAEVSLPPCHPESLWLLNDQAVAKGRDYDFAAARQLYEREIERIESCGGTRNAVATTLFNLAGIVAETGDLAEARRLYERAATEWSTSLGAEHSYVADAKEALADAIAEQGLFSEARALYQRVLAMRRSSSGRHELVAGSTLVSLARVQLEMGEPASALAQVDEALALYRAAGAARSPDQIAMALDLRAEVLRRQHQFGRAEETSRQALALRDRTFGPEHPLTAESRAQLALLELVLRKPTAALGDAVAAERATRQHVLQTVRYLPERQALEFLQRRVRALDVALSSAVTSGGGVGEVFDAVMRARGVGLDELVERARTAGLEGAAVSPLLVQTLRARQRVANLLVRSLEDVGARRALDEARLDLERAERSLAESSADSRSAAPADRPGLEAVHRALPAGSALVSFVRFERITRATAARPTGEPALAVFVLRADRRQPALVDLGPAALIDQLVEAWRAEASRPSFGGPVTARPSGAQLRRAVWDPFDRHVKGATRIFVVPEGTLNLIPLGALQTDSGSFLVEVAPPLHVLTAERDLVRDAATARGPRKLLALGGPAFDSGDSRASDAIPGAAANCAPMSSIRFPPLPGTFSEVQTISKLWSERHVGAVHVLTGGEATEHVLKHEAGDYGILHLATHGFFLGDSCLPSAAGSRGVGGLSSSVNVANPLRLSGLALAGANRRAQARADEDDGILTAEEVAMLDLQGVEWAVLSACDTGVGEVRAGEGVFGLRRAFQVAGARTVIMSLWSVDDRATRDWMRALYEGRFQRNLSTADAVHQASLTVLRDRRARGLSTHPFYWAAFVAAGDWR